MKAPLVVIVANVLLFAGVIPAKAESFDCQHPALPLARLVCGDTALRAADTEESAVYDSALLASLDHASLRAEESAWFAAEILPYNWYAQRNMPIGDGEIVDVYRKREEALRRATQAWRKLRHDVPGGTLAESCLPLPIARNDAGCSVAAYAPIEGAPALRYQSQIYSPPAAYNAMIIFAAAPEGSDKWLPVAVTTSKDAKLDAPQVTSSTFGSLLTISGETGAGGVSALYRLTRDALADIDDRSWLETLRSRLPDGLALSPAIVADYAKMQAVATVTRSQSTCCAVGSTATIDLAIEDQRVVVKGITFSGSAGPPSNRQN